MTTDRLSKEHRSWNMSRIRGKDTKPELILRSVLHRAGYRFRLHKTGLPGKPDIVLPRYNTAVFVHGCYWHRHPGCRNATTPSANQEFWIRKFEATVIRDQKNRADLQSLGWKVLTAWECEIRKDPDRVLEALQHELEGGDNA